MTEVYGAALLLAAERARSVPTLTEREILIVRAWYGGEQVQGIGRRLGVSRQRAAQLVQQLRDRGVDLAERPQDRRAGATARWAKARAHG